MLSGFKKLITRRNKLNVQDEKRVPHSSAGTSIPAINEDDSVKNEVVLESEQKYKKFDEDAVLGIGIFEGLKIIYANPAFALIFGYSIEELLSFAPEQIRSLIHPQDQKLVLNNLRNRLAGFDITQHYQFRAISKDGNTKTLELCTKKIEFDGKPVVQAICIDLTEKIKTRKALEYSEEKFKKIFENSGIGMSILDPKGKFIKVNKSFADMFNYNFAEFIGLSLLDVTHPSEIEHSIQLMKSLRENKEEKNKQLEKKYIKKW
ncbi:MAG: PAS domain-containing protein [Ignavibacteria bacterium]|nr:PAS domain-containing protein [Ignavibacteria bacterium]